MASETEVTVRGRLGQNPELQLSTGKRSWLRLRLATSPRIRQGETWVDGPTSWYDVKVWGDFAENVAESLRKGDAVIVQGELLIEEYQNANGVTLRTPVIHAHALGPDLRSATSRVSRVQRNASDVAPTDGAEPAPADHAPADDLEASADESAAAEIPVDLSGMVEVPEEDPERLFARM